MVARRAAVLLHAVSVALLLLPHEAERTRLRAWVARHSATSFAVRRRSRAVQVRPPTLHR